MQRLSMKRCAGLVLAAAFCTGAFAATPAETVAAFHAALKGGDKETALAMLSPAVTIYESGHVERTRDEYAHHHLGGDIEFGRTTTRKVLKQQERVEGNLALLLEETETNGTFKGKPVHAFGVETAVLEKQGDRWVIVHVHWSSRKAK